MTFRNKIAEPVLLLVLTAFGGLIFWQSSLTKITVEEPVTARMYGMIISGLFLASTISRLVVVLFSRKNSIEGSKMIVVKEPLLILIACVVMFMYTFGIINLGYYVSTFVYVVFMIMLLRGKEGRSLKTLLFTALGSAAFCGIIYIVFKTFKVYLPNALLF